MAWHLSIHKHTLLFDFEARTSRGAMPDRAIWLFKLQHDRYPGRLGIGECAPLPGLSREWDAGFEDRLPEVKKRLEDRWLPDPETSGRPDFARDFLSFGSSVVFALETAWLDWCQGGQRVIFMNGFHTGTPIPINGLIWMGGLDFMLQQVEIKIREGFRCLKLKVGGLDFEKECDILQYIRRKYFRESITLRLDANGAFKPAEALYKLQELSKFTIHSIEQPLKPGSPDLAELCAHSPIPIALDEELIGLTGREAKENLLRTLNPAFIVIKPSLHGGISGTQEWISLAEQAGVGWWITSALESSIGLNAIAQLTAQYPVALPQGLGTGAIYQNNIPSPLIVRAGQLQWGKGPWDLQVL